MKFKKKYILISAIIILIVAYILTGGINVKYKDVFLRESGSLSLTDDLDLMIDLTGSNYIRFGYLFSFSYFRTYGPFNIGIGVLDITPKYSLIGIETLKVLTETDTVEYELDRVYYILSNVVGARTEFQSGRAEALSMDNQMIFIPKHEDLTLIIEGYVKTCDGNLIPFTLENRFIARKSIKIISTWNMIE